MRNKKLNANARQLRKRMTDAERRLWSALRLKQIASARFRRQHVIGPYSVDFACLASRVVIEVDGGQHAENLADQARDAFLHEQGWRVLRFWNDAVLNDTEAVLQAVWSAVGDSDCPLPNPPPHAGEGEEPGPLPGGNESGSLPRETGLGQGQGGGRTP